jgi:sugar/nucleoside kinase (ribokinase family)
VLDFLAVGDVMLDVRLPSAAAGTRQHGVITSLAAGSAVNAARAAARLGARAGVAGAVGDDSVGRVIESEVAALGVEVHVVRVEAATTGIVVYGRDGVVADRGANALYAPESLPAARAVLVSGYLPAAARARTLRLAQGLTAVDLQGVLDDEPDAEIVLGPGLDLEALARHHRVVCSTLGAGGAAAARDGERASVTAPRVLDASPIGAGDAFAAGFLLALADDVPLAECLDRGCRAALA